MRKNLKGIFFLVLGTGKLLSQESAEAKESKEGRLDFTANIQNNHIWRGLIITDKPVVMGNLSYAPDAEKKWKVGIWGASALADDKDNTHYKEINYYIQYSDGRFISGYGIFTTPETSILRWLLMISSAIHKEELLILLI